MLGILIALTPFVGLPSAILVFLLPLLGAIVAFFGGLIRIEATSRPIQPEHIVGTK